MWNITRFFVWIICSCFNYFVKCQIYIDQQRTTYMMTTEIPYIWWPHRFVRRIVKHYFTDRFSEWSSAHGIHLRLPCLVLWASWLSLKLDVTRVCIFVTQVRIFVRNSSGIGKCGNVNLLLSRWLCTCFGAAESAKGTVSQRTCKLLTFQICLQSG